MDTNLGGYIPGNVFTCWSLGPISGLDFLHLQDVLEEHRVLLSGGDGIWAILSASLPCMLPQDHTGTLWSTLMDCSPTGVAFPVGPSQPGVETCLRFSGTWRGTEWTGGMSANENQDIGIFQPSCL